MRQSASLTLAILFLLVCSLPAGAQTCDVETSPGTRDLEFDAVFTQNGPGTGLEPAGGPGWTGADSTYSILLPNGDTAFFFSDSYIAEYPALPGDSTVTTDAGGLRTRAANCQPPLCDPPTALYRAHNSVVIRSAATGQLRTLVGPPDLNGYSTSFFTPALAAVTNHFYWMGDSAVVQADPQGTKKLWVFVMEFDNTWTYYGSALAQLSLPDLKIEEIRPLGNVALSTVAWGSALMLEGDYPNQTLYVYGIQNKQQLNGKLPYVARVNAGLGYAAVADTTNWTVWNGSAWAPGLVNATQIIGAPSDPNNADDQISDEFSVKKVRTTRGSAYLLVGMDTTAVYGTWRDITLYSACSPQGPFSAKRVVYSTPETGSVKVPGMSASRTLAGPLLVYNPHLHPQFNPKAGLLISYNLNASKSQDLVYADAYRPRFIRVKVKGLR
jgi:hypothetical protein